jgi:lantibiotic biosynthesis protein
MVGWRPLVPGEADQLIDMAVRLGDALAAVPTADWDASLAGGHAGVALFHGWLSAVTGRADDTARARHHRDQAIIGLAREPLDASLWGGFPGVAWAVGLVDGLVDPETADRNEAIDATLVEMLTRPALWPLPHDLVSGVTGAGVYALSRLPRPSARQALELVLDRLEQAAARDGDGAVYWWTPSDQIDDDETARELPSGYGDLGVAHGVAGAIGLLGLLVGAGVEPERAGPLLDGAVRWLWKQTVATPEGPSVPVWTAPDDPVSSSTPARSAWCYGDPGVAAALLLAARAAGRADWARQATDLALRSTRRRPEDTGVDNGGVCHGSAGLAHLYHRLYRTTGEEELAAAARYWLADTVRRCRSAATGEPGWVLGDEEGPHWVGADIVDGAAGVGLVLLAAATGLEPAWDRMFLLS